MTTSSAALNPRLVLGTATLGLNGSRAEAWALLDAYVEAGGTMIDTAAVYNDWVPGEVGRSEAIIGDWLKRHRGLRPRVATKGAHPPLSDIRHARLDRASIFADVDASLRRLGVERIDLYYLHRDDPKSPVEPILETLASLVAAGKLAEVGVSNWSAARVAAARAAGIVPISSNQTLGNVLCRQMGPLADPTTTRLDAATCADATLHRTSLMLYSSQCAGFFARRLRGPDTIPAEYRTADCARVGSAFADLAASRGIDPTAMAVAFLLAFSPHIFAVVGPRNVAQLAAPLDAGGLSLDPALVDEIAAITGFLDWR